MGGGSSRHLHALANEPGITKEAPLALSGKGHGRKPADAKLPSADGSSTHARDEEGW